MATPASPDEELPVSIPAIEVDLTACTMGVGPLPDGGRMLVFMHPLGWRFTYNLREAESVRAVVKELTGFEIAAELPS